MALLSLNEEAAWAGSDERGGRGRGRTQAAARTGGDGRGRGRFVAVIILAMENRSCCTHECADAAGGGREGQQRAADLLARARGIAANACANTPAFTG